MACPSSPSTSQQLSLSFLSASLKPESSITSESQWQLSLNQDQVGEKSTKQCRACNQHLPIESFPHFSTSKAGRKNTCKSCTKALAEVRSYLRERNPPPPPGPCPICKQHTDTWVLDHCHFNSTFRGYICNSCNLGLGRFNDDPRYLMQALYYLIN